MPQLEWAHLHSSKNNHFLIAEREVTPHIVNQYNLIEYGPFEDYKELESKMNELSR